MPECRHGQLTCQSVAAIGAMCHDRRLEKLLRGNRPAMEALERRSSGSGFGGDADDPNPECLAGTRKIGTLPHDLQDRQHGFHAAGDDAGNQVTMPAGLTSRV